LTPRPPARRFHAYRRKSPKNATADIESLLDRPNRLPHDKRSRPLSDTIKPTRLVKFALAGALALGAGSIALAGDDAREDATQKVESIDFRKLKEWLPAELNGIKRKEAGGEKNRIGDITVSTARATFQKGEDENSPRIEIEVVDYGGVKDMAQGLAAAWTAADVDRESDNGYERTIKLKNQPAMETWDNQSKHGQVQVLAGKRYIVTLQTDNIPAEQIKKIAESLALDKLAEMK
jgi:hypothetical protein